MNVATKPPKRQPRPGSRPEPQRTVEVPSAELHAHMKKATGPVLLTRKGKTTGVAVDLKSYRKMMAQLERLETIDGIARGLDDIRAGRVYSWEEVRAELEGKRSLSHRGERRRTRRSA